MNFSQTYLKNPRPKDVHHSLDLPRRKAHFPSPSDWRDEVLYFLLVDRFSDGGENKRPLLDRSKLMSIRQAAQKNRNWRWNQWAKSGAERWQGGTLKGVSSKLGYLKNLGITTIWLSPVFKQRAHLDTYHGYGIQDFLEVDPHFGTRKDLVDLVSKAHAQGIRVLLDIIFNHSGANWIYDNGEMTPRYKVFPGRYGRGKWFNRDGEVTLAVKDEDDGVWPQELQDFEAYTRAGKGDLGRGDLDDPHAENKRTDFFDLRDFNLGNPRVLDSLVRCYKYWIALTDCDGFRMDTLKHVSLEEARNFCGSIKEFASNLGKQNFFLVGEVAGGDFAQDRYLDVLERNLDATLDIGQMRPTLNGVAKGLVHPTYFFNGFDSGKAILGSHRNIGTRHVSILDDHDHVIGDKIRFSSDATSEHQVVVAVALQLFSLGIPCVYYGTEQAFSGPESSERKWLPGWKNGDFSDRYLREAMFGPAHPRKDGKQGLAKGTQGQDLELPGFGPFGTAGHHCFDENHPTYLRIAAMTSLRKDYPVLRYGRQYQRQIAFLNREFNFYGSGEIIAWSRILDDEEALCVVNPHGTQPRGAQVIIDSVLNSKKGAITVLLNSAQAANPKNYSGSHPIHSKVPIRKDLKGNTFIEIRDLGPSEVLVLENHA